MNLLVGLGNPGNQYTNTRHNVGWIILKKIFSDDWKHNRYANASECHTDQWDIILPETYMNESGSAVSWYVNQKKYEHVFVIYDDIDLPIGTCKMSFDRGSGGHNGIKSIEQHLGTREFFRIRVGIGKVVDNNFIKPNVLGNFESGELLVIETLIPHVKKALDIFIAEGKEKAMTFLNTQNK